MRLPGFLRELVSVRRFGSDDPRWWVYLGRPRFDPVEQYHHSPIKLIVEFAKFGKRAALTYNRSDNHTLCFGLGWTVYVSWDRKGYDWPGQDWGIRLWDDRLSLQWACDDSGMSYFTDVKGKQRSKPRHGWEWHVYLMDAIFGQRDYTSVETGRETLTLTMPEGGYRADCTMTRDTWTRPRWPWRPVSLTLDRAHIDFDPPVGIPGKGENGWDCDDDATFSLTTSLKHGNLRATLDEFALDTLRTRQHRGGLNWQPRDGWQGAAAD